MRIFNFSLTLLFGLFCGVLAAVPAAVRAESVNVACSGTSGAPTVVDESVLANDDITFTNGGGNGYCILDNPISAASVTVNTGVTITHALSDLDGITISTTGNFSLASGAYLDASARGCIGGPIGQAGYGPDLVTGICAQNTSGYGKYQDGGASHAGAGGRAQTTDNSQSTIYGSVTNPSLFGSGGGGGEGGSRVGGNGGGIIHLTISGTLTVGGNISADGGNGNERGGGGSGGSIYISAGTFAGSGLITVDGGNAGPFYAGGGGGGRVAIYYNSSTFTLANVTADYGSKSTGLPGSTTHGGLGTTYILDQGTDTVIIPDAVEFQSGDDYTRANITFLDGATVWCDADGFSTLNFGATGTFTMSNNTWTCSTVDAWNFSVGTWAQSGTNTISFTKSGALVDWTLGSHITLTNLTYTGPDAGSASALGGVLVLNDAINLTLVNTDLHSSVDLDISQLSVDANSSIIATGKGCVSGNNANGNGYGPNTTTGICTLSTSGYGKNPNGGAAHAGTGGREVNSDNRQLTTYGSSTNPILFGSGGGGDTGNGRTGGYGGGVILVNVQSLTLNGPLTANGGVPTTDRGGGGSGGSVNVSTGALSGSGSMSANGGNAGIYYSGGGGGGRVALAYASNSGFNLSNLTASAGLKSSVLVTNTTDGTVGSTYSAQTVFLSSLTITDNSGYTNDATPVITLVSSGATPSHVAFSCDGTNWSSWLTYPDDDVANDGDGPAFNMTTDATNCSATNELKTIRAKIKDASTESSSVSDTTTYDTVAPSVTTVSSSNVNATYGAGEVITVSVQFSDTTMTVSGTPQIQLDMDGTDRQANYASTSTDTLSFTYTIAVGDNKADLDYTSTGALTLNGGTIADLAGNAATLTLASPGAAGSLGANKNIVIVTNQSPTVASVTAVQGTDASGDVTITFIMDDPDNDNTLQAKIEYSLNGGSSWNDPTMSTISSETSATYGDPSVNNAVTYQVGQAGAYITTSSGANTVTILWEAAEDVASTTDIANARIRVTPFDSLVEGTAASSSTFVLDLVNPVNLSTLAHGSSATTQTVLMWSPASDTNFSHYEIWYASVATDATNRTGGAVEWDNSDDAALATSSTATTLVVGNLRNKHVTIFAVDDFGNELTAASLYIAAISDNDSPTIVDDIARGSMYAITLTSPTHTDSYDSGESVVIRWGASGSGTIPFVTLYVSTDGIHYDEIAKNIHTYAGQYLWTPEGITSSPVVIRIDATDLVDVLATDLSEEFSVEIPVSNTEPEEDIQNDQTVTDVVSSSSDVPVGAYMRSISWNTVYYVDSNRVRHPFLDGQTYFTYEEDFSNVLFTEDSVLKDFTLGAPMLPKPGTVLIKVQSVPKVYVMDAQGDLRWLTSEAVATTLFGARWADYVIDVPVTAWSHFTFGEDVSVAEDILVEIGAMKTRSEVNGG